LFNLIKTIKILLFKLSKLFMCWLINIHLSLSYLSFNLFKLLSNTLKEILEILFFSIELLELSLYSAILTFVMSEVTFAYLQFKYSY